MSRLIGIGHTMYHNPVSAAGGESGPGAGVDNLIIEAGGDNILISAAPATDVILIS